MRSLFLRAAALGIVLALVAAPLVAGDGAAAFAVRPRDSTVMFAITKWSVFKEEGRFHDFSGTVFYNPRNPAASSIEFVVHVDSMDTKIAGRDGALRGEDFFHTARYPTMQFRSRRVAPRADGMLDVTGALTIRGVTREVTVPVRVLGIAREEEIGELAGFETTFTINRTDFGVLGSRWSGGRAILGHEVTIHLFLSASRPAP